LIVLAVVLPLVALVAVALALYLSARRDGRGTPCELGLRGGAMALGRTEWTNDLCR
jgi:hypothetical protein